MYWRVHRPHMLPRTGTTAQYGIEKTTVPKGLVFHKSISTGSDCDDPSSSASDMITRRLSNTLSSSFSILHMAVDTQPSSFLPGSGAELVENCVHDPPPPYPSQERSSHLSGTRSNRQRHGHRIHVVLGHGSGQVIHSLACLSHHNADGTYC